MVGMIIFACMALAAAVFILLRKRLGRSRLIFWLPAALIVLIVVPAVLMNAISRMHFPSRVDVSPLAQLTPEQVTRAEYIFAQLEGLGSISGFEIGEQSSLTGTPLYSFDYQSRYGEVRVRVFVYLREEDTALHVLAVRDLSSHVQTRNARSVWNDNKTGAVLGPARSVSETPISSASFWSTVRIDNVIIELSETRRLGNLSNDATSEFIALLVEMLQE